MQLILSAIAVIVGILVILAFSYIVRNADKDRD